LDTNFEILITPSAFSSVPDLRVRRRAPYYALSGVPEESAEASPGSGSIHI